MAYQPHMPEDSSTTEQMKEAGQHLVEEARDTLDEAQSKASGYLRSEAEKRSQQLGVQVRGTGSDLRDVSQTLREKGNTQAARVADQAAQQVERVADYVQHSDLDTMVRDVEEYARRNPLTVAVAGLALGFIASRFLRASSAYDDRQPAPRQRAEYPHLEGGYAVPRSSAEEEPTQVIYGRWQAEPGSTESTGSTGSGGV